MTEVFLLLAQAGFHLHSVLTPRTLHGLALGIKPPLVLHLAVSPLCWLFPLDLKNILRCLLSHNTLPQSLRPAPSTPRGYCPAVASLHCPPQKSGIQVCLPPLSSGCGHGYSAETVFSVVSNDPLTKANGCFFLTLFLIEGCAFSRLKYHLCFAFWILMHPNAVSLIVVLCAFFVSLEMPMRKCVGYVSRIKFSGNKYQKILK